MLAACCNLYPYIARPIGTIGGINRDFFRNIISGNAAGGKCNSVAEIRSDCTYEIPGNLSVQSINGLTDDLPRITRIKGNLTIRENLNSFPDFASLRAVEGDLMINTRGPLESVADIFPVLDSVYGNLRIINVSLVTIGGFANLEYVGGDVSLTEGSGLKDVSLGALLEIKGSLLIDRLGVTTLPTFSALKTIGDVLRIRGNTSLVNGSTFPALTGIGGDLIVELNEQLTTLPTFPVLTSLGALTVRGNTALSDCCAFLPLLKTTSTFTRTNSSNTVFGNAKGCLSVLEARKSCAVRNADLRISTDAEVPADVMYIPRIVGNLTITGSLSAFPNFASLEEVQGNLTIEALSDASLTALADIFPVLNNITGNLVFQDNANVVSIDGFSSLATLGGDFYIERDRKLTSIGTFSALKMITGSLVVAENDVLATFPAFSILASIGDSLAIGGQGLTTLSDFPALTSIGLNLSVRNTGLTSLPNFSMLAEITGDLSIRDNAKLTTLPTFPALTSLGALTVRDNAMLASCCAFLPFLETKPPFTRTNSTNTVSGNAMGCLSVLEARKSCAVRNADLRISSDGEVPADVMYIPRIVGNLTITGNLVRSLILLLWRRWKAILRLNLSQMLL